MRRVLFLEEELERWEDGAPLEVLELECGGRIVRPLADAWTAALVRARRPRKTLPGQARGRVSQPETRP
jgi:hypothetical protein